MLWGPDELNELVSRVFVLCNGWFFLWGSDGDD